MLTEKIGTAPNRMAVRAVAAATVGTALEWFDFTLYGAVSATVLPKVFFPTMTPTGALLASLTTFGVGLAARPLGAILCGHFGDKIGRRNLLLVTVTVMGLSSVLIGVLPTYAEIGATAQFLLVSLRIIQGFALGGELTGAQLMALEHAESDRRGFYSGLLGACSPLSQILANATLFVLSTATLARGLHILRLAHSFHIQCRAHRGGFLYQAQGQGNASFRSPGEVRHGCRRQPDP